MSAFTVGFVFMLLFTLLTGIGAVMIISFDAPRSDKPASDKLTAYRSVRHIQTDIIETVDEQGDIQRWHKAA